MSRAFTKEDDAGEDLPERPVPAGTNYVTPRGLRLLQAAAEDLVTRRKDAAAAGRDLRPIDRDLRYFEARLNSAVVVPAGKGPEARFGARVTINDAAGRRAFQIVGEDEARGGTDFIAWSAPLAQALFGAKAGDTVSWKGDGDARATVVDVSYPPDNAPA